MKTVTARNTGEIDHILLYSSHCSPKGTSVRKACMIDDANLPLYAYDAFPWREMSGLCADEAEGP
jgi:hypothetical protein